MCDEEAITRWAKQGLSRRQFAAIGGITALSACSPMTAESLSTASAISEKEVSFATQDGMMDGFFVAPDTPSPAVIIWPDIAGLREAKRNMARRLASGGYAALVVNPYYRDREGQIWSDFADFAANGGWPIAREMRKKHTPEAIMHDTRGAVAWLDTQDSVDSKRGIGTQGYCMGGPMTVWSAAASLRVDAAASFHGGGLVRDDIKLSPHLLMDDSAQYLIAIAKNDDARRPNEKDILRDIAARTKAGSKVAVYDGDHGWTVPDSPVYAASAAEQAWADMITMYEAAL